MVWTPRMTAATVVAETTDGIVEWRARGSAAVEGAES
jgi:hypothetical protein